jgi:hypothetical protein
MKIKIKKTEEEEEEERLLRFYVSIQHIFSYFIFLIGLPLSFMSSKILVYTQLQRLHQLR